MESLKFGKNSNDIMKFDFEENRHIAEHTHPDIEILYLNMETDISGVADIM